jgi:hypothetical protein
VVRTSASRSRASRTRRRLADEPRQLGAQSTELGSTSSAGCPRSTTARWLVTHDDATRPRRPALHLHNGRIAPSWIGAIALRARGIGRRLGRAVLTVLAVGPRAAASSLLIASTAAQQYDRVSNGGPLAASKWPRPPRTAHRQRRPAG